MSRNVNDERWRRVWEAEREDNEKLRRENAILKEKLAAAENEEKRLFDNCKRLRKRVRELEGLNASGKEL